jgi:hypothetical protein
MTKIGMMVDHCNDNPGVPVRSAYRLFRDRNGEPATLYHTHEGSSVLPTNKWLKSAPKVVYNPGKRTTGGKGFRAGFHVFPTLDDLIKYSKTMDGSYAVVEVLVAGRLRPKPRSRSTVLLAERMTIPLHCWNDRLPLAAYLGGEL